MTAYVLRTRFKLKTLNTQSIHATHLFVIHIFKNENDKEAKINWNLSKAHRKWFVGSNTAFMLSCIVCLENKSDTRVCLGA